MSKNKVPNISVNVPSYFEFQACDYHQFDTIQYVLKSILGLKYNFKEIGCDGFYHAIFWIGKKPTEFIKKKTDALEKNND